jgi:ribosomal protein S18 acetylase RimI-like enzyme
MREGSIMSGMQLEIRKANLPEDARELRAIDLQIFGGADAFEEDYWLELEAYWILAGGRLAGCTAFRRNVDFQDDLRPDEPDTPQEGTLYIETTGILPDYRCKGLGTRVKNWQIDYARTNGFRRVVTNCRESNSQMIALNVKHGFKLLRTTPAYYEEPVEATVVMEALL